MSSSSSTLTSTQKYAAGALFALALHQAQLHQIHPLGFPSHDDDDGSDPPEERVSTSSSSDFVSDDPQLWVHQSAGLLRPVFKFLEIDSRAWGALEETVAYSPAKHHVGAFLRLLSEESGNISEEIVDKELALAAAIDAMCLSMEKSPDDYKSKKEKQREYENACREKFAPPDKKLESEPREGNTPSDRRQEINAITSIVEEAPAESMKESAGKPLEEVTMLSYPRKLTVLYELLSACLADTPEDNKKFTRGRKGYDARHRVALRLLATWFDVKWKKMEAIETMIACSVMALLKVDSSKEVAGSPESSWAKLKRGGIIGAAALTGGALMAITGGLAAPAIAAGFGALAPTLGTIIPVIGASGFAAVATAAGSVAGSVAVAASLGAAGAGLTGSKMARRIGEVDEFEFKAIGENHNQGRLGVEISVSGFVFEEEDFVRPWEGQHDNLERYVLQWESKHLIAVSTAIQDYLTSRIAMELMKQGAMMTVLSSLLTALAWPATLLVVTDFIDSKWSIALNRSDKAGKLLAEVLLKGLQGQRPVTLVGFSLGARVIFRCLQILSESEANAGIVERVVLLGAPIAIKDMDWEATRKVVAGRYVNAYSTNDWMLGIAFRANLLTQGLAGIQPVNVPGIENVDVTEVIEGHSSYLWRTQQILEQLELDTYYPVFNRKVVKS
ncbi:transmembrane and coiled-coil domain-containing protein 4-like [Sesamum indicum]|uniref:Transmembrane and coiled-coil domain-containing protein 4-like n=1 Tax=Sesamum indicum TaxID=4182 RepID=A0A6I9U938_SESIN|nr:transmembrane and coiled-coil domain-containing protein 4-like [Sesamum indicum]XP_011090425.1 transmembrane and coiled-coil domain-containing protein 4-like [Sesamum indicum]